MSCSFCQRSEVDSFVTEAGNNAELSVDVSLCRDHLKEYERNESALLSKYAARLDDMAYDQLAAGAEMLGDDR